VDDDDLSLEVNSLVLRAEGHRLLTASSGQAAIEILDAISSIPGNSPVLPNVVLTDFQMPDMTGQELCRRIRSKFPQGLLLIGMSATAPPEDQLQEFDAFISKPLHPQTFQEILTKKAADRAANLKSQVEIQSNGSAPGGLDMTVVEKLRKLMPPDALEELYATYISDTRVRLTEMEQAAAAGDEASVRRCAHMMKGSASMTGAVGISKTAAILESGGVPSEHQKLLFDELRCACDAIEGTLARDARIKEAHEHQIS
jgi:CheY-like chemotaxis protein/HPt (histidine-containing phosphotransfer) domain-containing protein